MIFIKVMKTYVQSVVESASLRYRIVVELPYFATSLEVDIYAVNIARASWRQVPGH